MARIRRRQNRVTLLNRSASQTQSGDVPLADVDLFRMLSERNDYAITCLFDRYSRLVYSTAHCVLRDAAAAEDVMQELFLDLWRRPPAMIPTSGGLAGWFVILSRNRAISLLRKRKHVVSMNELTIASPNDLSREAEKTVLFDRVCGLMTVLPGEQQKVLTLAFFEGLTHPEIARLTGHALGTVKTRIRTRLRTLHKDLARKHERIRDQEGLATRLPKRQWKPVSA
jgi:RNA polymerase sigma-70 factor, ECF subfamily